MTMHIVSQLYERPIYLTNTAIAIINTIYYINADQEARGRSATTRFRQSPDESAEDMEFDTRRSFQKNVRDSSVFLLGVPLKVKEADILSRV